VHVSGSIVIKKKTMMIIVKKKKKCENTFRQGLRQRCAVNTGETLGRGEGAQEHPWFFFFFFFVQSIIITVKHRKFCFQQFQRPDYSGLQ
jgi:hypothetical protein